MFWKITEENSAAVVQCRTEESRTTSFHQFSEEELLKEAGYFYKKLIQMYFAKGRTPRYANILRVWEVATRKNCPSMRPSMPSS
jgi:hypothetical protein